MTGAAGLGAIASRLWSLAFGTLAVALLTFPAVTVAADSRIETVVYDPASVVTVRAASGYAVVVELGSGEHIDSVFVGDSAGWQVTATKRGDHLVVKPRPAAAATNMVVVTADKTYVFLLELAGGSPMPFVLRFEYPAAPVAAPLPVIAAYRFSGARDLLPAVMYDDGTRTTIAWTKDQPLPAVFALTEGQEHAVNGRFQGGDYVLDEVAPRFLFRSDKRVAVAVRQLVKKPS